MEVTKDVILDLLPLYLADEASADTRILVQKYLETDPELAELAEETAVIDLSEDIPIPITRDDKMEAYKEAKRLMFWRTLIVAILISFTFLALISFVTLLFFLFSSG